MNLNCHDGLDRERDTSSSPPPCYPDHVSGSLGTQLPCRSSSPSGMGWYADHIRSLERDFCSDFTCCGQSLPDLHKLVDHFEEAHVVVIGTDGNAIYPRSEHPTLAANSLHESPHASASVNSFSGIVVVEDTRTCTFSEVHPRRKVGDGIDFDAFSGSWPNLSADQLCLPPSSFTACTTSSLSGRQGSCLPSKTERKRPRGVHGPPRRRDKLYKCPRPGCTKSYLNPNGLKYHLEKGTCNLQASFNGRRVNAERCLDEAVNEA
ncbi:hypothetical protein F5I97DRAFT_674985 [Phlebopus sp. FC_14]|nr:hypothetical protein F5I97DRAFT_674985 [Phlebopus sp. FC_14]